MKNRFVAVKVEVDDGIAVRLHDNQLAKMIHESVFTQHEIDIMPEVIDTAFDTMSLVAKNLHERFRE